MTGGILKAGWKRLPAILAFSLLAFQVAIPWTAARFLTQDGPSHLYTALVARDLLFHSNSPYAAVYMLQPKVITNWTTTLVLNLAAFLAGPEHAEQILATLCVIAGFFAISYLRRSIDPGRSPWSPVTNFLINTWFLWIGFYNFYLGMALCAFLVGFAIRHVRAMTVKRAVALAAGLVVLFFTHVLTVSLALMAIGLIALWIYVAAPLTIRAAAPTVAALVPATILLAVFVFASAQDTKYQPGIESAWNSFPKHVFASARGRTGEQTLLYPAMLFYMLIGVAGMRRREWSSVRGALVVSAALSFVLYLLVPNEGFGGDEIKIRFAWAVFVFGCVVASTVGRLRMFSTPLSIYIACFSAAMLLSAMQHNVREVSRAAAAYTAAMESIPPGSTFVRMRYPADDTRRRYGYDLIALEPMLHADAFVAANRRLIDLSDYQAVSQLFPVIYRPFVNGGKQRELWMLEGMGQGGASLVNDLRKDMPVRIDYVVLLGDPTPKESGVGDVMAELDAHMRLVSRQGINSFVRVYQAGDYFTAGAAVRR